MDTTKLKPFDLERAKSGGLVVSTVNTGCMLKFHAMTKNGFAICESDYGHVGVFETGRLRMAPRKVKRYHIIFKIDGYFLKEKAEYLSRGSNCEVIEHEWEE